MGDTLISRHHQTFEGIRQVDEQGNGYWIARKLAKVLEYSQYRHFLAVIERVKAACKKSARPLEDHFEDLLTMVDIGTGLTIDSQKISQLTIYKYSMYCIFLSYTIQP